MKIFSSFDTNFKQQYTDTMIKKYGKDNVVVVSRGSLYFHSKVLGRIAYGVAVQIIVYILIYYLLGQQMVVTYGIVAGFLFGGAFYRISLSNYIDYIMDYAIFTPDEAILVEQISIFDRNIKSLDVTKIKSITIHKNNLFFSMFNSGVLTIINEGNDDMSAIKFNYVYKPEITKDKIHTIIISNEKRHSHNE